MAGFCLLQSASRVVRMACASYWLFIKRQAQCLGTLLSDLTTLVVAVRSTGMLYLLEQDEVHDGIGLIMLSQLGIQCLAQGFIACHCVVYWHFIRCHRHEVVEDERAGLNLSLHDSPLSLVMPLEASMPPALHSSDVENGGKFLMQLACPRGKKASVWHKYHGASACVTHTNHQKQNVVLRLQSW